VHPSTRLDDSGRGRWRVVTQTSAHHLDFDRRAVTRVDGAGTPVAGAGFSISALRRDHESVPLLELVCCEVGAEMELLLSIRDDCVTIRRTTSVVAITPAVECSPRA